MLKVFVLICVSFIVIGCVPRDIEMPRGTYNGNFIDNSSNSWAESTNIDEEDIDISDIDEEIIQTDMTTLAQTKDVVPRMTFPITEYKRLAKSGKATVKGQVYLIDLYGERVYGTNTRLYLNPITSYSNQWYRESYIKGQKMSEPDSRLFNYLRFTASDSNGNFAFYGVPSGSYYLIGVVKCAQECGYDTLKSIRVATKVKVQGNQIVEQDLYRQITQ